MGESINITVQFFFQKSATLLNRKCLKQFLANKLFQEGKKKGGSLRIVFCSDDELLRINRDFLNHDYYTDIITFPFTEADALGIEAELYISVERVKDNAKSQLVSFSQELHRVIFHGVLHLCGYGDKGAKEIETMRRMEEKWLREYFNVPRATVSG